MKKLTNSYIDALLANDRHRASKLVLDAVEGGASIKDIYRDVFQESQYEIGRLWQHNEISVAQEHYCTAATQLIMSQLYPYVFSTEKNGLKMVASCIGGELHEIGIRMVADFFEIEGWDTYFFGANTPIESIIESIIDVGADLLAVSASMTFNIPNVTNLINEIRKTEKIAGVNILVGGRPFNVAPDLWRSVGADGFAPDADSAVLQAKELISSDLKEVR